MRFRACNATATCYVAWMNLSSLASTLKSYRSRHGDLLAKLAGVERAINCAENELAEIHGERVAPSAKASRRRGADSPGRGRRGPGNDLVSRLHAILKKHGKPMGLQALADAVKRDGYASSSPAFPRIVAMRVGGDKKRFARVARGVYQAR